ncbi:MAG: hypothetical protein AAGJ83_10735 [Planctomycetota bacterium]
MEPSRNVRSRGPLRLDISLLWWSLGGIIAIELVCLILRFGFGKDSTTATASTIGVITFGYRVHHGYIGLFLIPVGLYFVEGKKSWGWWTLVLGSALFASDAIHHFLILWPITGSPDFDLVYPS